MDIHKEYTWACVKNETGKLILADRFLSESRSINRFIDRVEDLREGPASIVIEATGFCYYIYDILAARGHEVKVAHPTSVRRRSGGSAKTDKKDAELLVDLHRGGNLIYSHLTPIEDRPLRSETRHRQELIADVVRLKNRIQAILLEQGRRMPPSMKSSFTKKHIRWLRSLDQRILNDLLDILDVVVMKVDACDEAVARLTSNDQRVLLLKTTPGIGDVLAPAIIAELGDIERFHSAQSAACYAGIVPMIRQSAKSEWRGSITKAGNARLRHLLMEAVLAHIRFAPDSPISKFYELKKESKGSKKARVAAARKLLMAIYAMLRDGSRFTLIDPTA
jgi:transposase